MAEFKFFMQKPDSEEDYYLTYDNMTSVLREANGDIIIPQHQK